MQGIFGRKKGIGGWGILSPQLCGVNIYPLPENRQAEHHRSLCCIGCPYARHGLMCHDGNHGDSCLRSDMWELEERHRRERTKFAPTCGTVLCRI